MKLDTQFPLVDTQPLFQAMIELKESPRSCLRPDAVTRAFLQNKIKKTLRDMKATIRFMENELRDLPITEWIQERSEDQTAATKTKIKAKTKTKKARP